MEDLIKTVEIEDYWWPEDVGQQYRFSLKRVKSLHKVIEICKRLNRTRVVVQAGGSIGVWPRILSKHFSWVYTFEPEPISFHCLCKNVQEPNVTKIQAALGNFHNGVEITKVKLTSHHVANGKLGHIPQLCIDDLSLIVCDAVLLDIEGWETNALMGARSTIISSCPIILVETRINKEADKKKNQDIETLMRSLNYEKILDIELDTIYAHKTDKPKIC